MSESAPIGLSTAIWNSRYWLVGIHLLFILVLAFLYALLSLAVVLFAHEEHALAVAWGFMKAYWYAPVVIFSFIGFFALLISRQSPIDPTRSEPAGQDYRACQGQLEALCIAVGLSRVPDLYIIDHDSINALIWRDSGDSLRLYVTKGACEKLDKTGLDVVMAQQIGRLINGDPFIYPFMVTYINLVCTITLGFITNVTSWSGGGHSMVAGEISMETSDGFDNDNGAAFPILSTLLIFPALWLVFRQYGKYYGRMCEYRADLFAIRLTKTADGLLDALEAVKPNDRLFAFSDCWRELAFADPDPVMTLPWHRETDERLLKLRAAVGLAAFEHGCALNKTIKTRP